MNNEHEKTRQQVWTQVFAATAGANDCKHPDAALKFADAALAAFDIRFGASQARLTELNDLQEQLHHLKTALRAKDVDYATLLAAVKDVVVWWKHEDTHCEAPPAPILLDRLVALVGRSR